MREEAELANVPESLRQLLVRRLEALDPEARRVLEGASSEEPAAGNADRISQAEYGRMEVR